MFVLIKIKKLIYACTPTVILTWYHAILSYVGHVLAGMPSRSMIIIGVTGTKGKTSTANFIWSVLNSAHIKTGIISTANIRIGGSEELNSYHMTMPGRFVIPRLMRSMVKAGCAVCVVETTSEGLKQQRHRGIQYDIAVFTNLTPEHLPSHNNSFEEYKQTKGLLFKAIEDRGFGPEAYRKNILNKKIQTAIITNNDSEHASYYASFNSDSKITYGVHSGDMMAKDITGTSQGTIFTVNGVQYATPILGTFNVYNILPALVVGTHLGIADDLMVKGVQALSGIPGRMEIMTKSTDPYMVVVDYAHEKQSMNAVLDSMNTVRMQQKETAGASGKIIVVLGAEGGGRDTRKRFEMGQIVAEKADTVYVTNVDPYDDDPKKILEDIAQTAEKFGKKRDSDLFVIEDREQALEHAITHAHKGDIVIITGKGAEQSMILGSTTIPWDDRAVVRKILEKV